ncbi:hypothetical protein AAG570_000485 [Ranatra chinensis]|uniref:Uncharacterized protein n=1 Tax=Ranatra chinensis TaxID=642074 RepID=A0ABD0YX72_9HEMI
MGAGRPPSDRLLPVVVVLCEYMGTSFFLAEFGEASCGVLGELAVDIRRRRLEWAETPGSVGCSTNCGVEVMQLCVTLTAAERVRVGGHISIGVTVGTCPKGEMTLERESALAEDTESQIPPRGKVPSGVTRVIEGPNKSGAIVTL